MNFIAKQWSKLLIAALSLAGLVLMATYVFSIGNLPESIRPDFMGLTLALAYMVFFAGMTVLMVLKMLGTCKCSRSWVLLATGFVVTVFMVLALVNAIGTWEMAFEGWRMQQITGPTLAPGNLEDSWSIFVTFPILAQMIVIGFMPLIKGTKSVIKSLREKDQPAAK
ncbi:MAG: hypothetical protein FWE38_05230 [Firmicutes bacterium]|nr:hypothetical protein [Bacillota bacterium]